MKVSIHHEGKNGFIGYNQGNQEVMVTHPNELVRNTVRHYLNTQRDFTVSGSNNLDEKGNRVILHTSPKESGENMMMGLSEMFHHTGVHVDWGHKDNDFKDMHTHNDTKSDPNSKADKPIVKSIFGDDGYDIIN
jgi:hypothetical protein